MIFNNWKPERIFLLFSILVGGLLVVLTPPMCTPDENAHFMNAYSISRGDVFPEIVDGNIGRYVDEDVLNFKNKYTGLVDGKLEEKYTFNNYYLDSWLKQDTAKEVFYANSLTTISPVGYIFSSMGMAIGDLLLPDGASLPYNLLLFARIFNLAFYITCIYIAIKITPYFKNTMLLIALMPMSIFQASSINYDAILIPSCILLFSICLKLICSEENYIINKKDIIAVIVSTFFIVGIKQAYIPYLLLLFAIPMTRFGGKNNYIKSIFITAFTGIIAFIPWVLMQLASRNYVNPNSYYKTEQINYLFNNLEMIPEIIVNTFEKFKGFYLSGFYGKLGQLDTNFPVPIIILFFIFLFIVIVIDGMNSKKVKIGPIVICIFATVICVSAIIFSMYTGWTSRPEIAGIGVNYVTGIQGRYFIPLCLFLCIPIINIFTLFKKNKVIGSINFSSETISHIVIIINSVLTLFTVYTRFW